ncbi:putative ribonuclease H protein, partial [Trifolium medium]|nr:putative ribonuclease H protein [Trifolium medium]
MFKLNVRACVDNGNNIEFWKFKWFENHSFSDLYPNLFAKEAHPNVMITERIGNHSFSDLYPNLFAKEVHPNVMITKRIGGNGETPLWSWQWIDQLSASEMQQVEDLSELLVENRQIEVSDPNVLTAIRQLWRNDVPSKVSVFGWRLLLERLPRRTTLNRR